MERAELEALQLERLRSQAQRLWDHVPYAAAKMRDAGIKPADLRSLDDVRRMPITEKTDLRDQYPFGTFAVPIKAVVRLHASTGTTGKPTVVGYTRADMENWTELVARFLVAGGLTDADVVQIAFGYGLFTGGFGLHYGAERVGAAVIPASSGNTDRQLMLMRDLGTTALVCTPSYAVHLGETVAAAGWGAETLKLRLGFFGGESWSDAIRLKIQKSLNLLATDNYGLSEVIGPGVSGECTCQNGLHVAEDQFLFEIVDRETLQPLPDGETGEVLITPLAREAMPVMRYRTRDVSRILPGACPCGRTLRRMQKVAGRTDDMLIIRGVNVFPSQIEHVLLQMADTEPHYQLIVTRDGALDKLEIKVEVSQRLFSDEMKQLTRLRDELFHRIESALLIRFKLTLVEPGSLERFTGKARRVIDLRN